MLWWFEANGTLKMGEPPPIFSVEPCSVDVVLAI